MGWNQTKRETCGVSIKAEGAEPFGPFGSKDTRHEAIGLGVCLLVFGPVSSNCIPVPSFE
jgi:hypothetical protein